MAEELTPEQKKQKRNEYARAYYAKNKNKMKAGANKGVDKKTEKLAAKGAKTFAAAKEILAAASAVIGEAYKTGDQKIIDHTTKLFKKQMGLSSIHNIDAGVVELTLDLGVKKVKLPKEFVKQARLEFKVDEDETPQEIAVDPAVVAAMQDGDIPAELPTYDEEEHDEFEDDEDEEDDDEEDDDEEDDDEEDNWAAGRADFFREMEAMGVGDEDM